MVGAGTETAVHKRKYISHIAKLGERYYTR